MNFFAIFVLPLVAVANVLGVAMLVPQCLRMRHSGLAGVSATWIGLGLGINAGWLLYATMASLYGLVPVSLGALILYGWMLAHLSRLNPGQCVRVATFAGCVGVVLSMLAVIDLSLMGLGLGLLYTVQFAPAAWEVVRQADVSGVAPSTWLMALLEASIWALYGIVLADVGLIVGGLGASTMSLIVLVSVGSSQVRPV